MNETTETQDLTPCGKLGYKVGDRFELLENLYLCWSTGATILLRFDDGSGIPSFQLESDPSDTKWISLDSVKKLEPVPINPFITVVDIEAHDNQIKTEGEKDMIKQKQTHVSHAPKNKAKEKAQLVFTYTNGKKFVVRGLKHVRTSITDGVPYVVYLHETTNEVRTQESTVQVKVSNDLVTVEQINTDNSVDIVLDLRPSQPQEAPKKARGNARSKEEWEAIVAAKKAKEEAAAAAREAEAQALAQQVYGLALKHGTGS